MGFLNSSQTREEKISFFLDNLKKEAEKIKKAENIILCGATPVAKKILNNRAWLFPENILLHIEDFDLNTFTPREDGIYILCSRPNISKHLKYLGQVRDENIKSYQLLLTVEPRYSTEPYAYQYEKIVKQIEDIVDYTGKYWEIYLGLEDEASREIFMRLVLFRLTYDTKMHYGNQTQYLHYFDRDVVSVGTEEVFVDCGGYVGDTLKDFKKITKNRFKKYYLFEPDKDLLEVAKEKGDGRVEYINKGVWSKEDTLCFKKETAPGNGALTHMERKEGVLEVPVVSLDEAIDEATFIKMDIEGAELEALKGGQNLIRGCHPKLAVCAYHKYEDIRVLYEAVKFFGGRYKLYLRAELDNIDTELYYLGIPEKGYQELG